MTNIFLSKIWKRKIPASLIFDRPFWSTLILLLVLIEQDVNPGPHEIAT